MLLRRDVIVGFLGLSSASAAACTLLAPEWWTGWGRTRFASDAEWSEGAEETVEAEADGEAAVLEAALGGFVVVGAAMVGGRLHCGAVMWAVGGGWALVECLETQVPRGQAAQGVLLYGGQNGVSWSAVGGGEEVGQGAREATWTAKTLWWAGGDVRNRQGVRAIRAGACRRWSAYKRRRRARETGRCVLQRLRRLRFVSHWGRGGSVVRESHTSVAVQKEVSGLGAEAFLRVTGRQSLVVHDSRAGGQRSTAAGDAGGSLRVKYSKLEQRSAAREGQVKCVGNLCTASTVPCTAFCMRSGLRDFHYHYLRVCYASLWQ